MHTVERLAYTNRWRQRHPADKLILGGGLLVLAVVLPPWPGDALVLLAAAAAALLGARLPLADYSRLLAVPAGFLLPGVAVLAVSLEFSGAGPLLHVGEEGLAQAVSALLRAMAATAALLLIVLTTPFTELLALSSRLRLPAVLLDLMLMIYRFSTLTIETAALGRTAQASRLGYAGFGRSIRSAGLLAAGLLPRVLDRAARLQVGLTARGYTGELRVLAPRRAHCRAFIAGSLGVHALIVVLALAAPASFRSLW